VENYDLYNIYDEAIPYKKDLLIYPARMRKYLQFFTVAQVLLLDKNSVPDAKIIQMSFLDYIYHVATDENYYITFLDGLLRLCMHIDDDEKTQYYTDRTGNSFFEIGEEVFDKNDFEKIRKIIIEQNLLNPPDDTIQKSLRDDMEEARRLRQKISGNKTAGIEEQMIAVMISTGLSMTDVYDMTIRKFIKTLERVDHKLHYEIYLAASMSGFVTFKDKSAIKHWLSDLSKNKLEGLVRYEDFEEKVSGAAGKK